MVIMLKNMQDPADLGRGMAIALLTILYAIGLAKIVINPLELRVVQRASSLEVPMPGLDASVGQHGMLLTVVAALMGVGGFLILLAVFV